MWVMKDERTYVNVDREIAVGLHFDESGWFFVDCHGGHCESYPTAEEAMRAAENLAKC